MEWFTYIFKDLSKLLGVEVSGSATKRMGPFRITVSRLNRDDDALSLFTPTDDLSRVTSAECRGAWEMKASDGFENTRLSGTLSAHDYHLS